MICSYNTTKQNLTRPVGLDHVSTDFIQYIFYYPLVLGRCLQTSVLSLAGSLPINDR